jgi:anti-sigma regulatory factor (Ser/Thr protein kinase)
MTTSTLRIPADTEQVRVARMVAVTAARRAGVAEEDLEDVRLAAGEAVGRAVLRQQAAGSRQPVVIELTSGPAGFGLSVTDRAGDVEVDEDFAMAVISGLVPSVEVRADEGGGQRLALHWAV